MFCYYYLNETGQVAYFIKLLMVKIMSNKYAEFLKLSSPLQELLINVKEAQLNDVQSDGRVGHYDERGYYAEFDSENCKPYLHTTILEAQDCPWVDIHGDSDESREKEEDTYETQYIENDDGEEEEYEELVEDFVSGVSFIVIKPECLDFIPDYDEEYQ